MQDKYQDVPSFQKIDEIHLEVIKHHISTLVSPAVIKHMGLKTVMEDSSQQIIRRLELFLTGDSNHDVILESKSYPENWWEALKERWFPVQLKKMFPIKFNSVGVKIERTSYFICPHLNFDYSRHQHHLRFFLTNPKNY